MSRRRRSYKVRPKTLWGLIPLLLCAALGLATVQVEGERISFDLSQLPQKVMSVFQGSPQPPAAVPLEGQVQVQVLDVGQGDSILIRTPEQAVLIDASEREYGERIVTHLQESGVTQIDLMVATHPHADHIGGMAYVMEHIPTREVLVPPLPDELVPTTRTYERLLDAVESQGVRMTEARPDSQYELGGALLEVLGPVEQPRDLNNASVVCRLTAGEYRFLFTGDMEKEGEEALLKSGASLDAHVLKVGHHGSDTSSTPAFLKAVGPICSVISLGEGNTYGHPHKVTLEKLSAYGDVYRTDLNGTVVFTVGEDGLTVAPQRGEPKKLA